MNVKILLVLVCATISSCSSMRKPDFVARPNTENLSASNPFAYYQRCGEDWDALVEEWLETDIVHAGSMREIRQVSIGDRRTKIGVALNAAWISPDASITTPVRLYDARSRFLDSLSPSLGEECHSIDWMAAVLARRDASQWPMNVDFRDESIQPYPGEDLKVKNFIEAILSGLKR